MDLVGKIDIILIVDDRLSLYLGLWIVIAFNAMAFTLQIPRF